jgi:hypothetical protein
VTDRAPTADEAAKFQQWYSAGAPPKGAQPGASGDGGGGQLASDLLGSTSATVSGIGKGLAQMGAPPGGVSLREADPKGPVATWAGSENKQYPTAEKAGRYAAEYGPLALMPDIGAPEAFAKAVPELPRLARVVGKGAEGVWKGGVGGYTQGNPKVGAATGGGTAMAAEALRRFPSIVWPAGFMAMEAFREGGRLPGGAWHLAHPLAALAAAAMGFAPGVSGALGAGAVGPEKGSGDKQ